MQYVSVPTQYLSPDGFVTIHYDRDHLDCYEAQVRHNEELEYYVRENVSMLERALFCVILATDNALLYRTSI